MSSTHHTISVGVYSHLLDAFPSILSFLLIYSRSRIITTYWYGLDAVLPYYMEIDTTYVMVVNGTMGMDVSSSGLTLTTSVSSSMQAILDLLNLVTTVWGKHRAALPKHWPWWSRWGHFWYCWESHWKAELCCYEFHTNRATFLQYLISNIFSARYHIVAELP